MNTEELVEKYPILEAAIEILPTGSQWICNPPPPVPPSDIDFIVRVEKANRNSIIKELRAGGFTQKRDSDYPSSKFFSMRNGDVNLVITPDANFFRKFALATDLAKILNVQEKEKRIAVFRAVIDEETDSFYED